MVSIRMTTTLAIALAVCVLSTIADANATVPPFLAKTPFKLKKIIRNIKAKHPKCVPNVCFMLDGSGSVDSGEYKLQREFVFTAAGLLDIVNQDSKYSALQYGGTPAVVISEPTSNAQSFQALVSKSRSKQYRVTSITPAFLYCMSRFPNDGRAGNQPNTIVVLGDGRSNFGPLTGPFGPAGVAKLFRSSKNNEVAAVAVGNPAIKKLAALTGSKDKVLRANVWGVLDLQNLFEPLVDAICKK